MSYDWLWKFLLDVCPVIARACALIVVLIFSGATGLPDVTNFASDWISATALLFLTVASDPAAMLCASIDLTGYLGLTAELLNAIMSMPDEDAGVSTALPDKADFLKNHMSEAVGLPDGCRICWDEPAQTPIRLSCNHAFCKDCLLLWLKTADHCPMCLKRTFEQYHRNTAHYVKAWTLLAIAMVPISLAAQASGLIQEKPYISISYSPSSLCFMTVSEFKLAYANYGCNWWRNMSLASWVQRKDLRQCFPHLLLTFVLVGILPIAIAVILERPYFIFETTNRPIDTLALLGFSRCP